VTFVRSSSQTGDNIWEFTFTLYKKGAIRNRRGREAGDILHLTRAD
jgi:hypothetical protein